MRVKLQHLDTWNKQRQTIATAYSAEFKNMPLISYPKLIEDRKSVFHLYVIQAKKRNALQKYLLENGIKTLIHYPIPLHIQKCFSYLNYKKGSLPHAEFAAKTMLSLPIYPELLEKQVNYVADRVKKYLRHHSE